MMLIEAPTGVEGSLPVALHISDIYLRCERISRSATQCDGTKRVGRELFLVEVRVYRCQVLHPCIMQDIGAFDT